MSEHPFASTGILYIFAWELGGGSFHMYILSFLFDPRCIPPFYFCVCRLTVCSFLCFIHHLERIARDAETKRWISEPGTAWS